MPFLFPFREFRANELSFAFQYDFHFYWTSCKVIHVLVCWEEHRDALVHRRPHVIIEISKVYPYIIYGMGLLPIYLVKVRLLWSKLLIKGMVAYFCHHLSDNQIFMLTCQLFMSTCQIIMSTCQKNIRTRS